MTFQKNFDIIYQEKKEKEVDKLGAIKNRIGEHYGHWIVIAHDDEKTNQTKK